MNEFSAELASDGIDFCLHPQSGPEGNSDYFTCPIQFTQLSLSPLPPLLALISAFRNKTFLLLATAIAKSVKHFSAVTNTTMTPAIDKH